MTRISARSVLVLLLRGQVAAHRHIAVIADLHPADRELAAIDAAIEPAPRGL